MPRTARHIDPAAIIAFTPAKGSRCTHLARIAPVHPGTQGCEECLHSGTAWVHLRICLTCGHVGCCDSSPGKHATAHYHGTDHPIVRSMEQGEEWGWCYPDEEML